MASADPESYQWCIAIGFPHHQPNPTLTDGRFMQIWPGQMVYYTALGWFGSSGGGVLIRDPARGGKLAVASVTSNIAISTAHYQRTYLPWMLQGVCPKGLRDLVAITVFALGR